MNTVRNLPAGAIDVHVHCFTARTMADDVSRQIGRLRESGVSHIVLIGMVNTRLEYEEVRPLIPEWVENRGDRLFHEVDDVLAHARRSDGFILPMLDTRYLWGDVAATLRDYLKKGFRGIKGIYLPDGNDIGVKGVPETFGITLNEYRRREWEIFSYAESYDVPLLYHIDARAHSGTMNALLQDFPRVRVEFPHFGIGRKAFCKILDSYPNVFTDMANLLPHIRKNPEGYRDFIAHYQDRVCLGTDAMLYRAQETIEYLEALRETGLSEEVLHKVCCLNPRRFLGSALKKKS